MGSIEDVPRKVLLLWGQEKTNTMGSRKDKYYGVRRTEPEERYYGVRRTEPKVRYYGVKRRRTKEGTK